MITSNEIALKQGEDVINDKVKVAEILISAYINIAENTNRKGSVSVFDLDYVNSIMISIMIPHG